MDVFNPEPPPADAWFRTAPNVLPDPAHRRQRAVRPRAVPTEACADAVRIVSGEAPLHAATVRDKGIYEGKPEGT